MNLLKRINKLLQADERRKVVKMAVTVFFSALLDFAGLEYLSSAGLRVLLTAQKTMNKQGTMKVTRANEMILEIFEVTGFADVLTLE